MINKLTFIGAGSMAEAIVAGVVDNRLLKSENIFVANRSDQARLAALHERYGVTGTTDKAVAIQDAEAIIISPKPNDVEAALLEIKDLIKPGQVIVSVVAGISSEKIAEIVGGDVAVIRAMPNTSATIGQSATGLSKGASATNAQLALAEQIFTAIGTIAVIDEAEMHILTAISGSGPAYIYYLVEAMEQAAVDGGLEADLAKDLVVQTLIGAGEMLKASDDSAAELRRKVTSPNGVTAAGIETLRENEFQDAIKACVTSAVSRSRELGEGK